jgi:hypothetical protein
VGPPEGISHLRHPEVGDLYLTRTQLHLAQAPGQDIVTWHAPANSASAHALDHYAHRCRTIRCLSAEKRDLSGQCSVSRGAGRVSASCNAGTEMLFGRPLLLTLDGRGGSKSPRDRRRDRLPGVSAVGQVLEKS